MPVALVTASHSPLMGINQPAPEVVAAVDAEFARARAFIERFAPEVAVCFAPDHYNGVFYELMPPFAIGRQARSVGDWGTQAGEVLVHRPLADALAAHVLESDVDIAVSERLHVDHGFAQPLQLLVGGITEMPVVPVFVNSVAVPLAPMRRVRRLGATIGDLLAGRPERILLIGSGGLSHDPPVPQLAGAAPEVAETLIAGRNPPPERRAAREHRVKEAGVALAAGASTCRDLNPVWDREFLSLLAEDRLPDVDAWSTEEVARVAGNSAHEVRTWVAAYAALRAAGQYHVESTFYKPIPEWIAGFGITTARPIDS
ncbi:3-carboxyethylcatechol 2,3-dioxygenase [Qaidamihabitans albus]|uniref:3-carboxyethylcatechol 2,3-dioxygenase n=1 Tax=Qaidamihabitans albus TaxID=2795733 RepID=UPI0018F187CF|nr:3-carboxyethylcatechol 2,3-dioxygenase [Qaidamihabitans albus]